MKVEDTEGRQSTEYSKVVATTNYNLPNITSIDTTTTYNSITVSVSATNGTNAISKYYFSIDGGEYIEGTGNSYTFTGLTDETSHTIKVKVEDVIGRFAEKSPDTAVVTDAYKKPVVNTVTISNITTNSFKVTATSSAKEAGATISTYEFSKDGGSNWSEAQVFNEYIFTDLTSGVEFDVRVRVTDSNNRKSDTKTPDTKPTTIYENPKVTALTVDESTIKSNGFTVTATVTQGSNSIQSYYFRVSTDGTTWESWSETQTTNTYTFTELNENTLYYVQAKVEDILGKSSNIYPNAESSSITVKTSVYNGPIIEKVIFDGCQTTGTYRSIIVTATAGSSPIKHYYYSWQEEGGEWSSWSNPQTSNIYKPSIDYEDNKRYYFKVKVTDEIGNEIIYPKENNTPVSYRYDPNALCF